MMSINALPIRLLNASNIGDLELPGAAYIPEAGATHTQIRDLLGLGDTNNILGILSAVRAYSHLYGMLGEDINTYEHLFANQTLTASFAEIADKLRKRSSLLSGILNTTGLSNNFFLASSDMEQVAVAATALALSNSGVRLST